MLVLAPAAGARVLLVGSYNGVRGQYKTIQAAVDAAKRGDWILVGPGDYKRSSFRAPKGATQFPAGVLITKPGIYVRGMNRNKVIVDGSKPGSRACSNAKGAQNFGPRASKGARGLNGIEVWKAGNVWVQNLTVCNFLWWNGGAGSGKIGGSGGFLGSYLNATGTYYARKNGAETSAFYGIFSSNWSGGTFAQDYASNFSDSGFYVGACRQQCNQVLSGDWAEYSALGYSGSNSGGSCLYDEWSVALIRNKFSNNGGYGNPTNGDFDQLNFESHPSDCYRGNTDSSGALSPEAAKLQTQYPTCTTSNVPPNLNIPFLNEILCDTQVSLPPFGCQPSDHYPRPQGLPVMHRLPRGLKTMPNPCAGVPKNPWCQARRK